MQLNDYQQQAIQSIAINDRSLAALAHRTLGLSGEGGEVANRIKKVIRDRGAELSEEDKQFLLEKLGDVLYYVSALAEYVDLSLEDVASQNLQKSAAFRASRSTNS